MGSYLEGAQQTALGTPGVCEELLPVDTFFFLLFFPASSFPPFFLPSSLSPSLPRSFRSFLPSFFLPPVRPSFLPSFVPSFFKSHLASFNSPGV